MIRKATSADIDRVEQIYADILTYEQEYGAYTVWKAGVYPTRDTAEQGLAAGALYVWDQDGDISASMIADHNQPAEYAAIPWRVTAPPEEVLVIHLLCVAPSRFGQGLGKRMVHFAAEEGRRRGCQALRLDTGKQNRPAVTLYTSLGFTPAGSADMAIGGRIAHKDHLFLEKRL